MSDYETLVIEGVEIIQRGNADAWRLGELALQVETVYGQNKLGDFGRAIGVDSPKTLMNKRRVAAFFEKSRRRDNLSWSHHEAVCGRDEAEEWLGKAEQGRWTVDKLRDELAAADLPRSTVPELPPDDRKRELPLAGPPAC